MNVLNSISECYTTKILFVCQGIGGVNARHFHIVKISIWSLVLKNKLSGIGIFPCVAVQWNLQKTDANQYTHHNDK